MPRRRCCARPTATSTRSPAGGGRSAPPREAVTAVDEAVDVLDLAVCAPPPVLERDGDGSARERHLVAAERRQQAEAAAVDPVDERRCAERRSGPQHEPDLAVTAVAEPAGTHPPELVAAHRAADPAVRDAPHRQPGSLDE